MLQYRRADRVEDLMQKEISDILNRQIKDPRIADFCTVMRVEVSDDLQHAKVFISAMGDDNQKKRTMAGLKSAAGFIRKEIGHRIQLRHTPEILFVLDKSVDYSLHIDKLIKEFKKNNLNQE